MSPRISVVIPCYNRAASIRPTLVSVQKQTFGDFECLVIDDGSDDGDRLAAEVGALADARFRLIRRRNGGGGAARNTGIDAARGEWIALLDSDDLFLLDKLQLYFAHARRAGPDAVLYSQALVDRGSARRWVRPERAIGCNEPVAEYLFVANCFIQTSTIMARADLLRAVRFDPALRKGQDLDLCVRLAAAGARFEMVPTPLTVWVDREEAGRTSRAPGASAPAAWLARAAPLMTARAAAGYRATVLAYYLAETQLLLALSYIWSGWREAGVPAAVCARQALRCLVPRPLYRRLANVVVAVCGRRRQRAPP
ncbi:putative glycosly transferase [Oceanicola granulosus HTCC2516]|uniref:Putative glycosly transferase n=1 Tax=Oceanicola granulosus (strain ATCC BAA-861 / DSM 15982 / KCTC 12143 / HTCC2516) TaxID=314256 RepID=Q2CIL1_OCEGH|nr:glycosyltransferase family 2 protein [Oceanicola granulosus]EAR52578.1 putative glycosly transferase [Oceanicola granulosus HTCC2516]